MRGPASQVAGNRFVSPKRRLRQKTGRFDFQAFRALGVQKAVVQPTLIPGDSSSGSGQFRWPVERHPFHSVDAPLLHEADCEAQAVSAHSPLAVVALCDVPACHPAGNLPFRA